MTGLSDLADKVTGPEPSHICLSVCLCPSVCQVWKSYPVSAVNEGKGQKDASENAGTLKIEGTGDYHMTASDHKKERMKERRVCVCVSVF